MNQKALPKEYRCSICQEEVLPRDVPTILRLLASNVIRSDCRNKECNGEVDAINVRKYASMLLVQGFLWTNTPKTVPFYQFQEGETTDLESLCDRLDDEQENIFQALADINDQVGSQNQNQEPQAFAVNQEPQALAVNQDAPQAQEDVASALFPKAKVFFASELSQEHNKEKNAS